MRFKGKEILINLEDPSAKGKIFSFETFKFYRSKHEELVDLRRLKIKKINGSNLPKI